MRCPCCQHKISDEEIAKYLASKGGKVSSDAKAEAARKNGARGGRPRKIVEDQAKGVTPTKPKSQTDE